jgi:hypothetical protein
MGKLRAALIESYAGAILVALVGANAISSFVRIVLATIAYIVTSRNGGPQYGQPFPQTLVFGAVDFLLYSLIAFAFLKWLYLPKAEPSIDSEIPPEKLEE